MRDKYLQEHIMRDPDGCILCIDICKRNHYGRPCSNSTLYDLDLNTGFPLDLLVTFNRMKSLSTDFEVIVGALNKSTSGLVEVSFGVKLVCVLGTFRLMQGF